MNSVPSGEHAFLLVHVLDAVELRHGCHFIVERLPSRLVFGSRHQGFSERVFGGEGDKGGAKQGVRAGGEHLDVPVVVDDAKQNVGAL